MAKRKTGSIKKLFNSLSLRFVLGTVSLTVAGVLVSGAVTSHFVDQSIQSQLMENNRRQAEYAMHTIDIGVLGPCMSSMSSLIVNRSRDVRRLDTTGEDGGATFRYSEVKTLQETLKQMVNSTDGAIYSISLYYPRQNILLSSIEGLHFLDGPGSIQSVDDGWISLYREAEEKVCFLPSRTISHTQAGKTLEVVSMVAPITSRPYEEILVCVNADGAYLDRLFREAAPGPGAAAVLLDSADRVVHAVAEDGLPSGWEAQLPEGGEAARSWRSEGRAYLTSRADSKAASWRCYLLVPEEGAVWSRSLSNNYGYLLLVLLLLLVLAAVTVSILVTYRTSRSVAHTVDVLYNNGRRITYRSIDDALYQIAEQTESQSRMLSQSRELVRSNWLLSLLHGREYRRADSESLREFLGVKFPYRWFTVMVLRYRAFSGGVSPEDMDRRIAAFLGHFDEEQPYVLTCGLAEREVAFLLNHEETWDFQYFVNGLCDYLESHFDLLLHCGVSNSCAGLRELPDSLAHALSALQYSVIYPHQSLFWYGRTRGWDENECDPELVLDFSRRLRRRELDEALAALGHIRRAVAERPVSYAGFRAALSSVESEIEAFTDDSMIDLRDLLNEPLRDQVNSQYDLDGVFTTLELVVRRVLTYADSSDGNKNAHYVRKAIQYIQENYSRDISIQDIADSLDLSRYYLCRLFKEATGATLLNHLTEVRMNKARELLQQTDAPVGEVAAQVGFNSVSYFNKKFKQTFGISPAGVKREPPRS